MQSYDNNGQQWSNQQTDRDAAVDDNEEGDNSHRPPNAFILYSQAMRSEARQQNPSLSNTEVSRILGKMWKEVPNEVKLQYKQKAAKLQEEFKKAHPDYTYRKARRKRALNELLTKSAQGFPMQAYPGADPMAMMQMIAPSANQMYPQMMGQQMMVPGQSPGFPGYNPMAGMPGQQMPGMSGVMGTDPSQQQTPQMYGSAMGQYPTGNA